MAMRLLEGDVADARDIRIADLVEQLEDAKGEAERLKFELAEAKRQGTRGMSTLRRQLSPLYRALQDVFGELDKAGVSEVGDTSSPVRQSSSAWEFWKQKMPGRPAQVIDALLERGAMNSTQIAIAIGIHRNNVPAIIHKLKKAGLIDKNGVMYSLKQL